MERFSSAMIGLPLRRSAAALAWCLGAAVLLGGLLCASAAAAPAGDPVPPTGRSFEVLRLDCASTLGRREVTLFGNGTIRLRDGPLGKEWMGLAELGPDDLDDVLHRLGELELPDSMGLPQGVMGDWIEKCDLVVELPGKTRRKFFFGRHDTLPLGLSRVVHLAEELGAKVATTNTSEHLPEGYQPKMDDVLKRTDGHQFRVVNFTSDKKGVELDGIDQPLHLIVLKEQMRLEFVGLISRQP